MNAFAPISAPTITVEIYDDIQLSRSGSSELVYIPPGTYPAVITASHHENITVYWLSIEYKGQLLGKPFKVWERYVNNTVDIQYAGESIETMSELLSPP